MSSGTFTDHHLKLFYGHLLNHYSRCSKENLDANTIFAEMYSTAKHTLDKGALSHLEETEKEKAYKSFYAIWYALPIYNKMSVEKKQAFKPEFNTQPIYLTDPGYDFGNSLLFHWLAIDSLSHSLNHHHPSVDLGSSSNGDSLKLLAILFVIFILTIAAVLTFIALYYMLRELADGIERIWYNEGWLKAALTMATAVAFGSAAVILSLNFASAPLIVLALAAGLNPVGLVIGVTVLLGIIAAGIGCIAMSQLHDVIDEKLNTDAIDPSDPYRFRLTDSDEKTLRAKRIDPITVKCALVALRSEIAQKQGNEKPVPSFFSRHFGEGEAVQDLLQTVRQLRQGAIDSVQVGELYFDCRVNKEYQQINSQDTSPSAPPQEYTMNLT